MYVFIWKTPFGFDLFSRRFERRARRRGSRISFPQQPVIDLDSHTPDLTAYEVGQLLGGN